MNRYQRRLNIIIMGIPEKSCEQQTLDDLFRKIWACHAVTTWCRLKENGRSRIIKIPKPTPEDKSSQYYETLRRYGQLLQHTRFPHMQ